MPNDKHNHDQYDLTLVKAIASGEPSAFSILKERYEGLVFKAIDKHLNDTSVSGTLSISAESTREDVALTVWHKLFKLFSEAKVEFQTESALRSYIFRVASNSAIDVIKQSLANRKGFFKGIQNEFVKLNGETHIEIPDSTGQVESGLDEEKFLSMLRSELTPGELDVFLYLEKSFISASFDDSQDLKKVTAVDIAEALSVNERTVRNRKKSIRTKAEALAIKLL